jgi:hypothetical protein
MVETVGSDAPAHFANVIGHHSSKLDYPAHHEVGFQANVGSQFAPVSQYDIADAVFAPDLHRELQPLRIEVVGRQSACNVVERRQTGPSLRSDQQRLVLGMGIRAGNQPVEYEGIEEVLDILVRPA